MQPAPEDEQPLVCLRDNTPVPGDAPQCRYPSSWCEFRELCLVREAERRKRRLATGDPSDATRPRSACG